MSLMTMEVGLTAEEIGEVVREAEAILVRAAFDDLIGTTDVVKPSTAAVFAGDTVLLLRPPRSGRPEEACRATTVVRWARSPPRSPRS